MNPEFDLQNNYIYYEKDPVKNVYFLKQGECGYVLPKYHNMKYLNIKEGCNFGELDIIGHLFQAEDKKDIY